MEYSQIESALSDATQRVNQARAQVGQASANLQAAKVSLEALNTTYSAAWQAIEDNLATAPDHAFEAVQKARKDAILAEVTALVADINAKLTALG